MRVARLISIVAMNVSAIVAFAALTPSVAQASGCTNKWKSAASGSWFTASNWSKGAVPTSGERVLDDGGEVVNHGTVDVANEATLTLQDAVFTNGSGGTVAGTGSGHVLVDGSTFDEGAGTTSGSEPVVSEDGTIEYTGSGASHIVARNYQSKLKGSLSAGQTFTIEGTCSSYAYVATEGDVTNGGTIVLTSGGCSEPAYLEVPSGKTLTNTGTISVLAGAGGERYLYGDGEVVNHGTVAVADGVSLTLQDAVFTNGSGGTVAGTGSGHVLVDGSTFDEGAGTTSGSEPVVSEDGTIEYTGSGASHIVARNYQSKLKGSLSAGQTFTIEGTCSSYAYVATEGDVTNGGTIVLTSGGCSEPAYLEVPSGKTLTNTGTISVLAGAGGERRLYGNVLNTGTLALGAGTQLSLEDGEYTQGKAGKLRTAIAGPSSFGTLAVSGLAVLGGTIEVEPIESFKASAGQKFTILTDTSRSGDFEFEKGGAISNSLYYQPVYSAAGVTLEASTSPPKGLPSNTAPPRIYGTPRAGQTLVLTHGTWTHSPFEYTDRWLRCDSAGEACHAVSAGDSYLLTTEDAGHTIRVQETATNSSGEGPAAESTATAVIKALELQARAGESVIATEGESVVLDGSGSTPASEIESYRWEFGDGESVQGSADAVVHHVYQHATPEGEPLTATLTVSHGGETSKAAVQVTVLATPKSSEALTVTVRDAGGHPLDEAEVVYVGPDGTREQASTNAGGEALLAGLPQGTDTVYAYKAGYRPATGQAPVDAEHQGSSSVTLESGEVATAGLSSHEMTLAEIEKAGIDPSDPANQNVYEFEIKLAFVEGSVPPVELHEAVNSAGQFVGEEGGGGGGGGGGVGKYGGGGGGGSWSCSSTQCEMTPPATGEGDRIVAVPEVVEGHPLIQWLILKGKATVLKQFFEVSMIVSNLSPEPFKLSAGHTTLNAPEGMSLAPTPVPQSATQSVAEIPGEGSSTTSWIVRGDEPGEYLMSADYEAALEPFAAPVDVQAALQTPLHVWGKEALSLKVQGDNSALFEGVPWHMSLGVTNVADVPLYNVELAIDENPHENFDFQPDQQLSEVLGELKPGQTVYVKRPYILVPDANSVSVFNPALSSATFVGEEEHPGAGIEAVTPPTLYAASAPTDTPGAVHLHWQAVPGAEGYEVFSTPSLTTAFQLEPDQISATPGGAKVTRLSAGATDAYETPAGSEPRWYAVSAVTGGHLELESSPMVKASAPVSTKPTVSNVSPASGSVNGGTHITITGTGFVVGASVEIGQGSGAGPTAIPASDVVVVSSTEITAMTGGGAKAGTWSLYVIDSGGTSSNNAPADNYTYKAVPTVSNVSPASGPVGGGTHIRITGTGFVAGASVEIGQGGGLGPTAILASNVVVVSPTEITATTGGSAKAGTWNLYVIDSGGTSPTTKPADNYTYKTVPTVSKVSPASGSVNGGTHITITGTGFVVGASVEIGQGSGAGPTAIQASEVVVVSPTEITATTGGSAKAGTWQLYVIDSGGTSLANPGDDFTYN